MMIDQKISVVLPCYNEKDNILLLVEEIHKNLVFCDHQIIVVDDNSPDGTFELVKNKNYPYVKTILRQTDRGFAKSIRAGIEQADGEIIIVMDSDFNHQPKYLPQMISNLQFYDCVTGSRFLYGGRMDSRLRHILSWFFNMFIRIITGKYITDNLYGFFAIKKNVLAKLNFDKIFWGYGDYCIRLMYYLEALDISILQFPAINGQRLKGQGNSRFLKTFIQYFIATIQLAFFTKK